MKCAPQVRTLLQPGGSGWILYKEAGEGGVCSCSPGPIGEDGCPNFRCPLPLHLLQIAPELERALYLATIAPWRHPVRISGSLGFNFMLTKQPCELFC